MEPQEGFMDWPACTLSQELGEFSSDVWKAVLDTMEHTAGSLGGEENVGLQGVAMTRHAPQGAPLRTLLNAAARGVTPRKAAIDATPNLAQPKAELILGQGFSSEVDWKGAQARLSPMASKTPTFAEANLGPPSPQICRWAKSIAAGAFTKAPASYPRGLDFGERGMELPPLLSSAERIWRQQGVPETSSLEVTPGSNARDKVLGRDLREGGQLRAEAGNEAVQDIVTSGKDLPAKVLRSFPPLHLPSECAPATAPSSRASPPAQQLDSGWPSSQRQLARGVARHQTPSPAAPAYPDLFSFLSTSETDLLEASPVHQSHTLANYPLVSANASPKLPGVTSSLSNDPAAISMTDSSLKRSGLPFAAVATPHSPVGAASWTQGKARWGGSGRLREDIDRQLSLMEASMGGPNLVRTWSDPVLPPTKRLCLQRFSSAPVPATRSSSPCMTNRPSEASDAALGQPSMRPLADSPSRAQGGGSYWRESEGRGAAQEDGKSSQPKQSPPPRVPVSVSSFSELVTRPSARLLSPSSSRLRQFGDWQVPPAMEPEPVVDESRPAGSSRGRGTSASPRSASPKPDVSLSGATVSGNAGGLRTSPSSDQQDPVEQFREFLRKR